MLMIPAEAVSVRARAANENRGVLGIRLLIIGSKWSCSQAGSPPLFRPLKGRQSHRRAAGCFGSLIAGGSAWHGHGASCRKNRTST